VALIGNGAGLSSLATHRCPHPAGSATGERQAGTTPALAVDCNLGPGGHCVPSVGGGAAGYYPMDSWTDNAVWNSLSFQLEQAHYFHYDFRANNTGVGYGQCQFTAQAFADLDSDSVFSTYERAGAADQNGFNAAAGLYIDRDIE
jgi:type IV pilus assembly protein PilA